MVMHWLGINPSSSSSSFPCLLFLIQTSPASMSLGSWPRLMCPWCRGPVRESGCRPGGNHCSQGQPWNLCSLAFPYLISILSSISPESSKFSSPLIYLSGKNNSMCWVRRQACWFDSFYYVHHLRGWRECQGAGWVSEKKPHEPVNCWLPPSIPASCPLSLLFLPFFLNKTSSGSKVYFESQVVSGV